MRFLTILKSGVSVKYAALEFGQALLKSSWEQHELNLEFACDFVIDILAAIGLDCTITPEQINEGGTYMWPMEQMQIYNFHYVASEFNMVEEFIGELCHMIKLQNELFNNELNNLHDDDFESPIDYLMHLVAVWCNAYKQLQKFEELQATKRFEEPLARINFHLLLGMHELRVLYRLDFYLLDAICSRLYWSALEGLFYQQTHDMILSGLLKIFSKDYDLFYASSTKTINFFYEAFVVEINTLTPLKLYQSLQVMLEEKCDAKKLEILLNFLIEPYMMQIYFTSFANKYKWYEKITTKNTEKIQQEALKFLNILQSKLITLDCFSRDFMEAILNLVFKKDNITSTLACNLYMNMMKRKFSDDIILKHIMDFYVAHLKSTTYLKTFVQSLCESFEFLLDFNNLLEIITDSTTTDIIRLLSAHVLVIIFELKFKKKDSAMKQELQHLLQILPEIFENLSCQKTEGILLKVYSFIPIEKLQKTILDNFIHYAVGIFTYTDTSLEYPLLMNIFQVFHNCLIYNQQWQHLELLTDHLSNKYRAMLKNLKKIEENQEESLSQRLLENYNNFVKRFNIIMKTKYDLLDNNYLDIIRNLSHYFLYNKEIQTLISKDNSLVDLYVLEINVSCFLKLSKRESNGGNKDNDVIILSVAQELYKFLWLILRNLDKLLTFPVVRIKTYFCCFLQLLTHLRLKLDTEVYQQLVQILVMVNFKNKCLNSKGANELQQLHPLQSLEYQRLMLRQFTQIHKYHRVEIHTNTVWKLCIYYGMAKHNFQEELKNLLIILADYRLKIYKHIISVLIYNLYKQTPALKYMTIVSILKQHKHLIDNETKVESSHLLKVHVVLLVLQILKKALSVQRFKTGHNRLEALKHLHIFIEDLNFNQLQVKDTILEQLNELGQNLIAAEERKILSDFEKAIN